jgi:hypothetical protein
MLDFIRKSSGSKVEGDSIDCSDTRVSESAYNTPSVDSQRLDVMNENNNTHSSVELGVLMYERVGLYKRERQTGYTVPVVQISTMIWHTMFRLNAVVISVSEISRYCLDNTFNVTYRESTLANFLNAHVGDLFEKSTRKSYSSSHKRNLVVVYGFTAKGEGMVKEYLSYLGGAHDDKLVRWHEMLRTKHVRMVRGGNRKPSVD